MTSQLQRAETDSADLGDVGRFLAIAATALRETAGRLEATVGRVSAIAVQAGRADREMVIALQDFDRLQQEFAAIAEVLGKAAEKVRGSWTTTACDGHPTEEVLAAISIGEVKERFLRLLGFTDWLASTPDEAVF